MKQVFSAVKHHDNLSFLTDDEKSAVMEFAGLLREKLT